MNVLAVNPAPPHAAAKRASSPKADGVTQRRSVPRDRSEPITIPREIIIPRRSVTVLIALVVGVAGSLPGSARGSTHANTLQEQWPRTSSVVGDSAKPVDEIVEAAKLDLAERDSIAEDRSVEFARWLFANLSNPEARLDA